MPWSAGCVIPALSVDVSRAQPGELSPIKNHQARTLPIPAIVSGELAGYKAFQQRGELVFPSASGTPLRNRNSRRDALDSAVEALGLRITPHNLRDTAASLAIQKVRRSSPSRLLG
jgi:integrase